ncbi:MAG: nucleotidyltransferase family protein [Epsilonproteobacteria bacterium]|nr:nucleotidyltransferase family protein [Campylobacterota bacterium]
MQAMILAAGRGERMRPLTDTTPKPLLHVRGKPLLQWHIENLVQAGFNEIIINVAHLGEQIIEFVDDGSRWGAKITISDEREGGALESAGGIKKALPLLGNEPFLVVNGDIFCNYRFDSDFQLDDKLAHLILVPNPSHNKHGDFGLDDALVCNKADTMWTFSGIGYYNPAVFAKINPKTKTPLAPLLRKYIDQNSISGEVFRGLWSDIGTPQRLKQINEKNII